MWSASRADASSLRQIPRHSVPRVQLFYLFRLFVSMTPIARARLIDVAERFAPLRDPAPSQLRLISSHEIAAPRP